MTTPVAAKNQPVASAATPQPSLRSPRNATTTPSTATAKARSSFQATARPAATKNHPQRFRWAAHQANSSGRIPIVSGWKVSTWRKPVVGCAR